VLAEANLGTADRILVNTREFGLRFWKEGEAGPALKRQGFSPSCFGSVVLMTRG
jgi:hypothetical protein